MNTKLMAEKIVRGLDRARRASSRDAPVDEHGLIAAALEDAIAPYRLALKKISESRSYQGGGCGTKLGRAIDIARQTLEAE